MRPFLDPTRDVLVSVEQTRHRLLALSALCPGASTLLANLLRRAAVPPPPPLPGQPRQQGGQDGQRQQSRSGGGSSSSSSPLAPAAPRTAGGRRWLRSYMNGCGNKIHVVRLASPSLAGVPFADAAAAMHAATGVLLIGVMRGGRASASSPSAASSSSSSFGAASTAPTASASSAPVAGTVLNPGRRLLRGGDSAVVICATGAVGARAAAALDYSDWLRGGGRASSSSSPPSFASPSRARRGGATSSIDYLAASASESLEPSASVDDAAAAAIALSSFRSASTWGAAATLAKWARAPLDLAGGVASAVVAAVAPERKARAEEEKKRRKAAAAAALAAAALAAKKSKASAASSGFDSDMPPPPEGVDCASVPVETESVDWEEGECDVQSLLPKGEGEKATAATLPPAVAEAGVAGEPPNPAEALKALGASPALSTSSFDDSAGYVDDEFYFAAERPRGGKEAAKEAVAAGTATAAAAAAGPSPSPSLPPKPRFSNHIIIAGADASFLAFAEQVRASDPLASLTPLVILSTYRPSDLGAIAALGGPVFWIRGDAASAEGLSAAAAASARALVYLALPQRPGGGEGIGSLGGGGGRAEGRGRRRRRTGGAAAVAVAVFSRRRRRAARRPRRLCRRRPSPSLGCRFFSRQVCRLGRNRRVSPLRRPLPALLRSGSIGRRRRWRRGGDVVRRPRRPSGGVEVGSARRRPRAALLLRRGRGRRQRHAALRRDRAVLHVEPAVPAARPAAQGGQRRGAQRRLWVAQEEELGELERLFFLRRRHCRRVVLLQQHQHCQPRPAPLLARPQEAGEGSRGRGPRRLAGQPLLRRGGFFPLSFPPPPKLPLHGWTESAEERTDLSPLSSCLLSFPLVTSSKQKKQGRVTVPAGMDAFACAGFFGGAGLLPDIMSELAGDDGRPGGAALRSVPVPPQLVGATYGQLFARFAGRRRLVPLGLYRRKSENATWRLSYVVTNPPPGTRLERGDRVFVLRERGGPWLAGPSADDDDSEGFGGQGVGGSESDGEEM